MKGKNKSSNNPTFFSKTLNVIKNPFFIIGFLFLIAIITYFVISHKQSNPSSPSSCNPTTDILCGGICYNKSDIQCVDGKPCSNQNFCPDPSPLANNTCCNPSQTCEKGKCVDCPQGRPICSSQCCPEGESCTGPGSQGSCCKTENITTDGQCCDPPSTICTSSDGKTKTCCNSQSGQTCNPATGTCVTGCPDINNMSAYKCPGDLTPPPIPKKSILCTDPNSVCTVDCSKTGDDRFVCQTQSVCDWGPLKYNPSLLKYGDNQIYQCSDTSGSNWIKSKPNLELTENIDAGQQVDKEKCNLDMCVAKIEGEGVDVIKGGISLDGNYNCTGKIDCSKVLLSDNPSGQQSLNNICNSINSTQTPIIYRNRGPCCITEKGVYTGQVCNNNEFCDDIYQKCYTGFEYKSSTGRCEPSKDVNQTFENCLSSAPSGICKLKENQCTNWSNCFCCPKYKNCNNCEYTYRLKMDPAYLETKYKVDVETVKESFGCGADHLLYIYVPSSITFKYNGNADYYYYKDPSIRTPPTISTPNTFDDSTTLYIFGSQDGCMPLNFTLNELSYTVINKATTFGCSPDICSGYGWCISITLNGETYTVNESTVNDQKDLGEAINAFAQIGSAIGNRPARIWISVPAKQIGGTYKYLNWGDQCPQSDNPNILPDDHHHKKINETKNINLFIFMIFIIIFLLVLYFFRK